MKKVKIFLTTITVALVIAGCSKKFDGLLVNPNAPLPEQANVDLLLNQVQLQFRNSYNGFQDFGAALSRMEVFFGPTYQVAYDPSSFDGIWSTAYTGVIKNADAVISLATPKRQWTHVGMANIMKAYTYMCLVDHFGNVPYTEANLGNENLNPKFSPALTVYNAAFGMLDSAIAQLARTPSLVPPDDLYYGQESAGSLSIARRNRWITLAKTLKLRGLINTRLTDAGVAAKINALITGGDLIDTDAEEFTFKYGTQNNNPNSRHPKFNGDYRASGGAGQYQSTTWLFWVGLEKGTLRAGVTDPRRRYYFHRQTLATPGGVDQQPCAFNATPSHFPAGTPYCYFPGGYWGRDHGDNAGIPPDNALRTVWGAYPAAGRLDANVGGAVGLNDGGRGAGINPIWMASFTDFILAEAYLTVPGVTGNAKTALLNGVTKSINRVLIFPSQAGVPTPTGFVAPSATAITSYVTLVSDLYDLGINDAARLDVVGKEYFLALWGNGIEAYNMYRRTSRPRNLQPTLQAAGGAYIRSFLYPSNSVNLNLNATQKPNMSVKTFWDTNPDALF
jgi:hypothetical protein